MSINDLLPLEEALKLKKPEFIKLVRKFVDYKEYCGSIMTPPKMAEWCDYLECNTGLTCNSAIAKEAMSMRLTTMVPSANVKCSGEKLDPNQTILLNQTSTKCFDALFCLNQSLAKDYHYLVGILGLLICLICIILTIIYIKGFIKEFCRSNTTACMLVVQAICDIAYIVIFSINIISLFIYYNNLNDILNLYSTFHVFILPYTIPIAEFFEALSTWIIVIFSYDRFNYLIHGAHSKKIITKKVFICFTIILMISLLIFMVLKMFMYELILINHLNNHYRLIYSKFILMKPYLDLIQFWIKMPLETLFPYSIIFIFLAVCIHQLIFTGRLNLTKVQTYEIFQEFRLTRSIILIGCCLLIVKIPKLTLYILINEIGINYENRIKFDLICYVLHYIYFVIKCCAIYPYMCPIYSSWLLKILCFESSIKEDDVLRCRIKSINSDYDVKQYLLKKHTVESCIMKQNGDNEIVMAWNFNSDNTEKSRETNV